MINKYIIYITSEAQEQQNRENTKPIDKHEIVVNLSVKVFYTSTLFSCHS